MSNSTSSIDAPLPAPKSVVILGVPFHDVTMEETLAHIDTLVAAKRPTYLATANLEFAAQASRDVELQRILLEAHLVLCDGTPLIWASRWLNAPLRERVAGSDLLPVLAAHCARQGHRLFLLGATEETLAKAKQTLEADHPGLMICGTFAPPVAKLLDFNNDEIIAQLRAAKPDILLVAFGCPKQEKWIYMNRLQLPVSVSIGVGASLDFVAGNFKRAPHWMRKAGLEWLFRLLQEPRRLFNRYAFDLFFFVRSLRKQRAMLSQSEETTVTETAPSSDDSLPVVDYEFYSWRGRADAMAIASDHLPPPLPTENSRTVIVDLSQVTFMDSTALGLLLRGFRQCKQSGGGFAVLRPSLTVKKLLAAMNLDRLIPVCDTIAQARQECGLGHISLGAETKDTMTLACRGDLVAGRVSGIRQWIAKSWESKPDATILVLDLTEVGFLDSSGLGMLVNARKLAHQRNNGRLQLRGANDNVRNVITLARMNELLGLDSLSS